MTTYTQDLAAADLRPFLGQLLGAHDIGLVVCNAGATHGVGAFLDEPLEKALSLVRLNCLTPVTVAHQALARRRARGAGLIIVSSMSALCGSGYVATYAAAKAFEIALCEGLHWELSREGIDVLCAVAGLTDTPAMRRSGLSFTAAAAKGFVPMSATRRGARGARTTGQGGRVVRARGGGRGGIARPAAPAADGGNERSLRCPLQHSRCRASSASGAPQRISARTAARGLRRT